MGSIQFDCPLCCSETFTSQQSLKYHLLSIIDNLLCTVCSSRFETIYELAKHLDEECGKTNKENAPNLKTFDNVQIKIENEDSNDVITNSILAKALLSPQKNSDHATLPTNFDESDINNDEDNQNAADDSMDNDNNLPDELPEGGEDENEEDIYSCSSCGISFTSIIDHIQEYHAGQEVVVETPENENEENNDNLLTLNPDTDILTDLPEGATLIASDGVVLKEFEGNFEEDVDSNESQDLSEGNNRVRMPQILNTLKQEDCIDKDGRLYTRKVVQIEKFWDDEPPKPKVPLILKYLVNDEGTLIKVKNTQEVTEEMQVVEMYQCSGCGVQFSKREQYDIHACDPEIGSEYKCSMCETTFTNSQSLCIHMKSHRTNKKNTTDDPTGPFICGVCDTVFPTNKSLRLHRRMHDPIKAKEIEAPVEYGLMGNDVSSSKPREMFECKVCGKNYDKSYEQMHMAYHSGVNHYDCYICNRKFYTHSNLEMHMRVHGNEKGHMCHHCKKGFISLEGLDQHLKQHCSTRPYQCSYCSRRFARPHEKVKHERIHTGEKPHECEICGKTFRVSYCLTLHMRTHSGFRPYVCQHCGKRFKAHSVYNHHLLTHSDVRAYKCPYCPKAFKTGVQLAGHKNSHTKPFSCTQCNRPFASLYAVRAHMETHKRENNLKYNCYLCGASYARAFALRDHIKEQHVDTPHNGQVTLDIIEEGMEATTSILPDNDDISMVTLEEIANVSEMEEETIDQ